MSGGIVARWQPSNLRSSDFEGVAIAERRSC